MPHERIRAAAGTASGLQDGGDVMSGIGLGLTATGVGSPYGALALKAGGIMSGAGTTLELIIDAAEGKLTTEKIMTKMVVNIAIPKIFLKFDKLMKPIEKALIQNLTTLGDRALDDGRNNNFKRK